MKLSKDKINLMSDDELNFRVAKILGEVAPTRSFLGFMEHYAKALDYTRHWSLATEVVELYVFKLFRNVGGTWTVVMKDSIDDGTMSGQPVFTSFADANPLRAMVKCLILHHQELNLWNLYYLTPCDASQTPPQNPPSMGTLRKPASLTSGTFPSAILLRS